MAKLVLIIVSIFFYNPTYADDKFIIVNSIKSVYDGDTFRAYLPNEPKDLPIRIRGVDTPEIKGKCKLEKDAAIRARDFTRQQLKNAKQIRLYNVGFDKYHRVLATVVIDGKNLATLLIRSELGRLWRGKRENWCL